MRTRNARAITADEAEHLALVKSCPCSVTGDPPPSEAHHMRQGDHFTAVALSQRAHTGEHGIHGDQILWRIAKMDELAALNVTLRNVASLRSGKAIPKPRIGSRQHGARTTDKIIKNPRAA